MNKSRLILYIFQTNLQEQNDNYNYCVIWNFSSPDPTPRRLLQSSFFHMCQQLKALCSEQLAEMRANRRMSTDTGPGRFHRHLGRDPLYELDWSPVKYSIQLEWDIQKSSFFPLFYPDTLPFSLNKNKPGGIKIGQRRLERIEITSEKKGNTATLVLHTRHINLMEIGGDFLIVIRQSSQVLHFLCITYPILLLLSKSDRCNAVIDTVTVLLLVSEKSNERSESPIYS